VTFPILISRIGEDMLVFQLYCEGLLIADGVEFLLRGNKIEEMDNLS
jgi:hypothetical protein